MKIDTIFKKSLLAGSIAMVTACGGSGSSNTTTTDGTTVGVVTGFGSIYVNGVEYETDSASIDIDGVSSLETKLGVGDVVALKGTVNADGTTGTATSVSCTDELEGYVIDIAGLDTLTGLGSINVMGQTVFITRETVFEGKATITAISDLVANDVVEVSGFSDGLGNVTATRIETKDSDTDVEIKGMVANLNTVDMTFTIGGLTVDYSTADVETSLGNDLYVEVKTDVVLDGTTMIASKVELEEDGDMDIDGDEGEEIEVQGIVTGITPTSFLFNGSPVEFSSVEIEGDFNVESLVEGMMITAEGTIDANGDFIIEEIELDHESEDEVYGVVTAKDDTTVTLTLQDNTQMTFTVNNDTRMIDDQDDGIVPLHYFSLADVQTSDYLKIEFYVDGDTNVATELKRDDAPM